VSGVSEELVNAICSDPSTQTDSLANSAKVRDKLKLWEILHLFLSAADNKATLGDFRDFLFKLDLKERATPQAIESAIKTHPDLFEEVTESGQRFLLLREPAFWIRTWEIVLRSIRARVRDAKRKYSPDADSIELIEVPAHTVVIKINRTPGATVQASISLSGTQIEIKTDERKSYGRFNPVETVKVQTINSTTVYSHDDQRLSGPDEVAEIILAPILDCVCMA
jgi:hypothetical protein